MRSVRQLFAVAATVFALAGAASGDVAMSPPPGWGRLIRVSMAQGPTGDARRPGRRYFRVTIVRAAPRLQPRTHPFPPIGGIKWMVAISGIQPLSVFGAALMSRRYAKNNRPGKNWPRAWL